MFNSTAAHTATFSAPSRATPWLIRCGPMILCALAGLLSAFTIAIGGLMPVGELVLLAVFPWVAIRTVARRGSPARLQQLGWFRLLLLLIGFTALGYVASDLYRATEPENLVRGWARIGFLAIDLIAIAYLIDRSWQRFAVFVLALQIGTTINAVISGPLYGEWWKFGFGYAATAVLLYSLGGRHWAWQAIAAALIGTLSIFLGARSLGAISIVTAGFLALQAARGIWRPIAFFGSLSVVAALLTLANVFVISQQDHAGSNFERRSMAETAIDLFIGSPLVGQGSWFTATDKISHLETKRAAIDQSFRGYEEEEIRKISLHSQLLVSLAEGGLLGGAFFFGLAALLLKTIRTLVHFPVPHRAFVINLVLTGAWNLVMSPFSGVARVEIALIVCACLLVILQRQGELGEQYHE